MESNRIPTWKGNWQIASAKLKSLFLVRTNGVMCSYSLISGNIFSVEKIKPVGYLYTSLPTARCQAKPRPKSSHLTKLLFTIPNSIPHCHKVKKDTFQCSNVLLILPKCWTFKIPSWKQIKISENQEKFFSNRMINAFYAREKKRHSAAQHTGENPFGHTVQWLQTNKYEIYISILLLPCITSLSRYASI